MCQKLKILKQNNFGELYFCDACDAYHLIFKNIHFILTQTQVKLLKKYIKNTNINFWEERYLGTFVKRKIPIPTYQNNLTLIFDKPEFQALKTLLFYENTNRARLLAAEEIEYNYVLN